MNDFWRIYRLVFARRWLITAMMLIAATVIFLGTLLQSQKKEYQAEALMQPQDISLPDVVERSVSGGASSNGPQADRSAAISDLIMILRSSNDLYVKTAGLLREDEAVRSVDVQRILERNGFFAPVDQELQSQAERLEAQGTLTPAQTEKWVADNKKAARDRFVAALAKGRDASGSFAEAGLKASDGEIADTIRQNITFDTVQGPLSTETNPQIVNQIRVTGRFDREAEANLYVNLLCVAFLDFYTNEKASAVNARLASLHEKLDEANRRLERARQVEVTYRKAHGVALTSATDTALGQAAALEARRNEAQADLQAAAASVTTLAAAVQGAQASNTVTLPSQENPEVRRLQSQVAEAQIAFKAVQASNEGAENNDKYITAKAQLNAAQTALAEALRRPYTTTSINPGVTDLESRLNNARVSRDAAQQRLNVLDQQLAAQREMISNLPAAMAKIADLRREIAISEQNVQNLETALTKQEMFRIEHGRAGTISIVSQAHTIPVRSGIAAQRGKLMVYGMILALLLGVGMVVGMDALDNSVRTAGDVEKLLGLPVAGIIPAHLPDPMRAPRVALLEPLSPISESYRLLRTDLLFTAAEKPFQSLMMATGKPGQGATTTVSNLAIVLAQAGKRVILVDADMRYPKLHTVFHTQGYRGLSTLLSGDTVRIDDALTPTEVENLSLIPAGPIPINPSELLASPRMRALHDELKQRADFVLFDTPSAIAFSDSAILASLLDATLMVIRSSNVPRGSEDQVRTLLNKARANLIGVVLNGVPSEQVDSVHYHYQYYPALEAAPGNGGGQAAYNPGGAGRSGNGHRNGSGFPDELPLALPGVGEEEPPQVSAGTGELVNIGTSSGNLREGGRRVVLEPENGGAGVATARTTASSAAAAYTSAAAYMQAEQRRRNGLSGMNWKAVLLVMVAGLVLGGLVLLLGSGTTVK